MTAKEIRQSFLDFFASKGHKIVPSAPMVIKGDPTLMFTNAGMNQFKDIILGNTEPKARRVADSQKCLRVSGKHNDLEEVGRDTYHHTMFEMLGNWSFGDYFKEDAIAYAWEYLVDVLKLSPDRLYVTVFEGCKEEGLERDDEAAGFWARHIAEDRIINGNRHDNFWEMGDTGPCGPCSEIHIDLRSDDERKKISGKDLVNKDHPQVVEIWNLVFMQYLRHADGHLSGLPHKVIDTGMGFERLCMALQGKQSNYDTDVFQPLIRAIGTMSGKVYGQDEQVDIAMRVIADHIRTIAFAITDGQLPSNAKAGYVIRRILRRAVRYGYTFLDRRDAFMYALLPTLIDSMGEAYPELKAQKTLIEKVIKEEEESFLRTLETGIKLLDKKIEEAKEKGTKILSGVDTFTLYDTFGFPLDLTELILREQGLEADIKGFEAEMQKQKDRARNAAAVETDDWVELESGETEFVGYDALEADCKILRYRLIKQKKETFYQVVLSVSPFYAEMGGQVGDSGYLEDSLGEKYPIFDTKRENNLPVHLMKKMPQEVTGSYHAVVDADRRRASECNHTATHLLHQALREILGTHVEQKGSFVSPEVLRFDFSHFAKMTDEELRQVERRVNERIRMDLPREERRNMPIKEAIAFGAMALFGEKYGDEVRVLKYGDSIELCGGTHLPSTGMIGTFRIVSESSIAAGIRRIEAVTGVGAEEYLYQQSDLIAELKGLLNNNPQPVKALQKLIEENAQLKKLQEEALKRRAAEIKDKLLADTTEVGGVRLFRLEAKDIPAEVIRDVAFRIDSAVKESYFFAAATSNEGRPTLTVGIAKNLTEKGLNAGQIVREAAKLIKGGGGGQPHFASAGGKDVGGLSNALDKIVELAQLK